MTLLQAPEIGLMQGRNSGKGALTSTMSPGFINTCTRTGVKPVKTVQL